MRNRNHLACIAFVCLRVARALRSPRQARLDVYARGRRFRGIVTVEIKIRDQDTGPDDTADAKPCDGSTLVLSIDLTHGVWSGDVTFPNRCTQGEGDVP